MGFFAIHVVRSLYKFLTRKSIAIVFLLSLLTFVLGTFGFQYFENEGIREDNEMKVTTYMDVNNVSRTDAEKDLNAADRLADPYDYHDSFYWTFTTVTTVGYGDVSPATMFGRIVYYVVGLTGISVIGIIVGELGSHLVELSFMKMKGLNKSHKRNHVIIVGWDTATEVAHNELKTRGMRCIVIDENKDFLEMKAQGVHLVSGNALDENVLIQAGIKTAKALIIPIRNDEVTVMLSLKARRLNKNIKIIADVNEQSNQPIVQDAGVTTMIPSSLIKGLLLANAIEENLVVDFIVDICQEYEGLDISQFVIDRPMRIKDINMGKGEKVITAYRRGRAFLDFTPETKLDKGDWVLTLCYKVGKKK